MKFIYMRNERSNITKKQTITPIGCSKYFNAVDRILDGASIWKMHSFLPSKIFEGYFFNRFARYFHFNTTSFDEVAKFLILSSL